MVTDKFKELAREANSYRVDLYRDKDEMPNHSALHLKYSRLAFDELFKNCKPTVLEFDEYGYGLIMSGGDLYRLILAVPKWNEKP